MEEDGRGGRSVGGGNGEKKQKGKHVKVKAE